MSMVKIKIDFAVGLIELEGDREFVGLQLEKLLPLMGSRAFKRTHAESHKGDAEGEESDSPKNEELDGDGSKKKRRVAKRPPAGASCRDRMNTLRSEGFFQQKKGVIDIVSGLAKKGWTYKANQVGAALTTMFEKGEVQRTKDGEAFKYYWDRGN